VRNAAGFRLARPAWTAGTLTALGVLFGLMACRRLVCGAGDPPTAPAGINLVENGDFELPAGKDADRPAHWDKPDGLGVTWPEAGHGHGKAIRMDTAVSEKAMVKQWQTAGLTNWYIPDAADNAIAATYGLSFYSGTIPVTSGMTYRVAFDYRGPASGAKVWVRGYGPFRGEKRRRYEAVVNCRVMGENGKPLRRSESKANWHEFSQEFHPTRHRPNVSEMKVMLYAYWPPAVYWFDNVRIEPVTGEP